jgi:NACalpha-BTF3-like transcription factor
MARLGSVLGAILAELDRARVVADTLTRDLVNGYRDDPILASMSVPRVLLDTAELTLRFSVTDLQEAQPAGPAVGVVAEGWTKHVNATILPQVLKQLGIYGSELDQVLKITARATRTSQTVIKGALAGKTATAARATAQSAAQAWDKIPPALRSRLGTKSNFQRELETRLNLELPSFIERLKELELVKAALTSTIDIGIRPADLPTTTEHIQELKLTLRGEDVTVVLQSVGGK